jgi:hypothetical protein
MVQHNPLGEDARMPQCTAKSKRSQQQCRRRASRGHHVCYIHGARTPTGFALPQTKTGRYSKVLPVRLAQRYEEAQANPRLLSVRDDLAVCEARLAELFGRLDTGESGALWQALRDTLDAFAVAQAAGNVAHMKQHLGTLRQLVSQGSADTAAWEEIMQLWDRRCRLVQTEIKTLVSLHQMVSTEQLMLYFGVITDAIQRIVTAHAEPACARTILGELSAEFFRLSVLEHGAEA